MKKDMKFTPPHKIGDNQIIARRRESNIELLRLVSMFNILVYHFFLHGDLGMQINIYQAIVTIIHIGVICFVLISGYFGIHTKIKSIINLYCLVAFYGVVLYLVSVFISGKFDFYGIKAILPFGKGFYWFIIVYFQLYLIAPFLNKIIDKLSHKEFIIIILVFAYFSFYLGLIMKDSTFVNGHNLANFIFIYLIGRYLRLYKNVKEAERKENLKKSLLCYLVVAIGVFLSIAFAPNIISKIITRLSFPYNSPVLIIMAVLVFNIFRNIKIQSQIINYAATSALAIYLLHENPCTNKYVYAPLKIWYETQSGFVFACSLITYALAVFFVCIFIDKVRIKIVELLRLEKISEIIEIKILHLWEKFWSNSDRLNDKTNQ
ncbi:MAG: acyltransferase [Dysgonamonadaceae bacterium]|jgi:surface polysaccharide O-acyltransferase-like enzyme|nr:acyltransferase [Dysgonamonadaceae bacterium]